MLKPKIVNPHNHNFQRYYEFQDEQPLYPFPLEDAQRAEGQLIHIQQSKLMARQALLEQIQYNKQKRELEKKAEMQVGKAMIHNAKE